MGFSENLCDLMQKKGISSYKLAKEIGVHISTVSNWREGKQPQINHLRRTADYLGVSVDELIQEYTQN